MSSDGLHSPIDTGWPSSYGYTILVHRDRLTCLQT